MQQSPRGSRRPSAKVVLGATAFLLACLLLYTNYNSSTSWREVVSSPLSTSLGAQHPITGLIQQADEESARLTSDEPASIAAAAAAYRERRGRHPPPHFDKWLSYAQNQGSLLQEDLYDQIYHDLEPFWGVEPSTIRAQARSWHQTISVRWNWAKPRVTKGGIEVRWMKLWLSAISEIQDFLPDMDIALNNMDEPRVLASWEEVNTHMQAAEKTRQANAPSSEWSVYNNYSMYEMLDGPKEDYYDWTAKDSTPFWYRVREACPPESAARKAEIDVAFADPIDFSSILASDGPRDAYVSNWTSAKLACDNPRLRYLHGSMFGAGDAGMTPHLFPIFSNSKIAGVNNDILIPGSEYLGKGHVGGATQYGDAMDSSHERPWSTKSDVVFWRGSATGGQFNRSTWRHLPRFRLSSMLNSTSLAAAEQTLKTSDDTADPETRNAVGYAYEFPLPDPELYGLAALEEQPTSLGRWSSSIADGGLSSFWCYLSDVDKCSYLDEYYELATPVNFSTQFSYKFLPDVDGQAYSARYRNFLLSTSLPLKATMYSEWHDSRLVAWKHFVPMHNSLEDLWPIIEYFVGYRSPTSHSSVSRPAHDQQARRIAEAGREWAEKVIRREDMIVYIYRLLLEYARICDDRREHMGWAADLT